MSLQVPPPGKRPSSVLQQVSMAMELPFIMVGGVLVGGGAGYLLDRWLHTSPALALVGGAFGFGVALRDVLRRLWHEEKKYKQGNDSGGE
jgi:F0F1-type ATP synthase assembly protein I